MANQIVISSGAKVRNLNGVLTGTTGVVNSLGINVANGIPQLDGSGKILVSQLPNSVMEYKGTWNAATNTPTLVNGTGNQGDVYLCNVAGTVNFGAGAITFAVGDQAIYSGTIWQKAGGSTGTVTSVAVTETGDALTITGSPITTSGTINIGFAGTSSQYVNGAGGLTTFPTLISSIGLSMPSAFTVTNSPLTANGTIAVTGAGTTAQYVRGDGSLATLPTAAQEAKRLITEVYNSTGATLTKGTVVYINGGQGNLPTVTKALATSDATSAQTYGLVQTDITNNNNGFVVVIGSLTDLDTQAFAAGTQLYLSGTTAGTYTSTKPSAPIHLVYVAIVVRSHPTQGVIEVKIQNGVEMDEIHDVSITSVANGNILQYDSATSLWKNVAGTTTNIAEGTNLYFTDTRARNAISLTTTGTSGVATYSGGVLNIPNYGSALSGYVPYTGATTNVDLGIYNMSAAYYKSTNGYVMGQGSTVGLSGAFTVIGATPTSLNIVISNTKTFLLTFPSTSRTYTYPDATGTLALTSDLSGYIQGSGTTNYVPKFTASGTIGNSLIYDTGTRIAIGGTSATYGVLTVQSDAGQFCIQSNTTPGKQLQIGYDHVANNSYLSSLNQGVAFTTLALQPNGGNVHIGGSTSNGARLQVTGTSSFSNTITIDTPLAIKLNYAGSVNDIQLSAGTPIRIVNQAYNVALFEMNNAGTTSFSGNVGIGTSSPNANGFSTALTINGTTNSALELSVGGTNQGYLFSSSSIMGLVARTNIPLLFYTNDTERMRITSGGTLAINTSYGSSVYKLVTKVGTDRNIAFGIQGGDCSIESFNDAVNAGTPLRIYAYPLYFPTTAGDTTGSGANMVIDGTSGRIYRSTSSLKYKKNVENYTKGLAEVMQMRPVSYKTKSEGDNNKVFAGFIAEEVHELGLNEFVQYAEDGSPDALAYGNMVALLTKAIQELKAEIDELKNK